MKHTKLLVDARSITQNPSGVGRYSEALMKAMCELLPEEEERFSLQAPSAMRRIGNFTPNLVNQKMGNLADYVRSHREITPILNSIRPKIFHNFFHITPRKLKPDCPTIVTLHDTIWIDHAKSSQPNWLTSTTTREFAKRAIPDSLRRASHVICVSDATADRATEWISREKMTVIGHGVDHSFFNRVEKNDFVKAHTHNGGSYICAIGNDKPYKNLKLLIDSFELLNDKALKLVLIGKCGQFQEYIKTLKNGARIILPGMLDDRDLQSVLSHASLFVFPSLIEGFGLPILEAMAAGVPTVVSDREPMRSVSHDASILFDPHDKSNLANALSEALKSDTAKALKEKGSLHAKEQTWKRCAQQTLDVYERVLQNSN